METVAKSEDSRDDDNHQTDTNFPDIDGEIDPIQLDLPFPDEG